MSFSGVEFEVRTIELDGQKIKLQIWLVRITENVVCTFKKCSRARLHKNTVNGRFSATDFCVPVNVFKTLLFFPVLFRTFSLDLSLYAREKIAQSTENLM